MVWILGCPIGARATLARVGTIVTSVAACPGHRRVVHRVNGKRRRSVGVAAAALRLARGNMRRRRQTDRNYIVVATDTVGIGRSMRKRRTKKRDRAGMTSLARQVRGNMIAGFA
jgi:hypothetical protein